MDSDVRFLSFRLKSGQAHRYFGVKLHKPSVSTELLASTSSSSQTPTRKPIGQTLLMYGVPPYCTQEMVTEYFENLLGKPGLVSDVILQPTASNNEPPKDDHLDSFAKLDKVKQLVGYQVAYVVFKRAKHLDRVWALAANKSMEPVPLGEVPSDQVGIKKWCKAYAVEHLVDVDKLQHEINESMAEYDAQHKAPRHVTVTEPDEEGWQTVIGPGKRKVETERSIVPTVLSSSTDKQPTTKRRKKKKLAATSDDFYKFQIQQKKVNHLEELRKKFEEDKKRIAIMKANRKFKPY